MVGGRPINPVQLAFVEFQVHLPFKIAVLDLRGRPRRIYSLVYSVFIRIFKKT